ncbi:MAG: alpha/beta hydrolase [Flavipsychrobacter sp.]|nr:alpha/beta hydrolase [Flavipsychrobacter sp.]
MIKADLAYPTHYIKLSNNCDVAYIDEGIGDKTLLFVHGLATYGLSWKKNIDFLKKYYRCIAIDLPGNGLSSRGNFPYSMNFFAGIIYDFIIKAGLNNVYLIGHSMGAQIVLTTLINAGDCADGLVLCAPAGFEKFTSMEKSIYHGTVQFFDFFSTEENSLRKTIRTSFYQSPSQGDDMIDDLVSIMKKHPNSQYKPMIEACIAGMLNEPVFDKLHLINQRTLVLFGERDALIPNKLVHPTTTRQIAEAGTRQMLHATLEMLPQCGHFLQIEKAAEVNHIIHRFIN